MSNEANSRNTVPDLRWAEASEVPLTAPDLSEPSSGAKDLGWVASASPNRAWWNWLHWGVGVTFRHIARSWALLWQREQFMPGAAGTEGVVTNGTGLSVDVTEARVWISGAWYTVPAANDLALATADATNGRIDLVYAKLTSGAPEWAVETGTASVSPAAPATPAAGVAAYEVLVPALAVAPSTKTDVREFGVFEVDTIEANDRLGAGWSGSRFLLRVFSSTVMWIGDVGNPLLSVDSAAPVLTVRADTFRLWTPITRKLVLGPASFTRGYDTTPADLELDNLDITANSLQIVNAAVVMAPLAFPKGVTITAVRLWMSRTVDDSEVFMELLECAKSSTSSTSIAAANYGTGAGGIGNLLVAATGLSVVVDEDYYYVLLARGAAGTAAMTILGAEVEYTESYPFLTA